MNIVPSIEYRHCIHAWQLPVHSPITICCLDERATLFSSVQNWEKLDNSSSYAGKENIAVATCWWVISNGIASGVWSAWSATFGEDHTTITKITVVRKNTIMLYIVGCIINKQNAMKNIYILSNVMAKN